MTAVAARTPRRSLVGVLSTVEEDGAVHAMPLRYAEDGDTREE
jgi:hypothetical protein